MNALATGGSHRRVVGGRESLSRQNDAYRSELEAARPNNRFMRRRQGLGASGGARYTEHAVRRVRDVWRHMSDNDSLPGTMTRRVTDNVIQGGFLLKPLTGEDALDEEILGRHAAWAASREAVDYYGRWTWQDMQWHMHRQELGEGEIFIFPLDNGQLQIIEADHCQSPSGGTSMTEAPVDGIFNGIKFAGGRPVSMFFNADSRGHSRANTREIAIFSASGARQIFHIYSPRRLSQWRGISSFQPVMIEAGMLDDLEFASLVKAQTSASITGIINSNADNNVHVGELTDELIRGADGSQSRKYEEIRMGALLRLFNDEEFNSFAPAVVSQDQIKHAIHILRRIGAGAFDISYEMILLDGSVTNFSGWKGSSDEVRRGFVRRQRQFASQFHTPVHHWRLRRELPTLGPVAQKLFAQGMLQRHRWEYPRWEAIQRMQDAAADQILLENNLSSPSRLVSRRGDDYDQIVNETITDNEKMISEGITAAERLNKNHPDAKVDWREVVRWGQPRGLNFSGQLFNDDKDAA